MTTQEQLNQICKRAKVASIDTTGSAGMTGDFGGVQVVWVDLSQKPRDLVDTVIHEGVHVYQHFLAHIGETAVGKESQAYGIAFIVTTLLTELERVLSEKLHNLPSDEELLLLHQSEHLQRRVSGLLQGMPEQQSTDVSTKESGETGS